MCVYIYTHIYVYIYIYIYSAVVHRETPGTPPECAAARRNRRVSLAVLEQKGMLTL